jgi:hypothetical protein
MSLRHHRAGNAKPWEHRPSDHTRSCAHRMFVSGPIVPLDPPGFFAKLFGKDRP